MVLAWTSKGVRVVSCFSWCIALVDLVAILATVLQERYAYAGYNIYLSCIPVTFPGNKILSD